MLNVDLTSSSIFQTIDSDIITALDVVWLLVQHQNKHITPPITDESFGTSLTGDATEGGRSYAELAREALVEAIIDFFPAAKRAAIRQMRIKSAEVETMAIEIATEQVSSPQAMEAVRTMMRNRMSKEIARLIGSSTATGSPG